MAESNDIYEAARLRALYDSNLLDTPSSLTLNSLLEIAKQLFKVKIVAISLIDEDRQWFKAQMGLDVSQTPRDISFCTHTIDQEEPLVINNTLEDAFFADNILVKETPFIRFYSGVQLSSNLGYKLGSFCLIDDKPRVFSNQDVLNQKRIASFIELELNRLSAIEFSPIPAAEEINNSVLKALHVFLKTDNHERTFSMMLDQLLALTESAIGFIVEIEHNKEGKIERDKRNLKLHAISNDLVNNDSISVFAEHLQNAGEYSDVRNVLYKPLNTLSPIILNESSGEAFSQAMPANFPTIKSYCGIPIISHSQVVGLVGLANRKNGYSLDFINAITTMTLTTGLLIDRNRMLVEKREFDKALFQAAHFDHLTGLPNRRSLSTHIKKLIDASRGSETFSVCYVDLDGFKVLNDEYGHEFGDNVLKRFAERLRQFASKDNYVSRLGGDEFTIVLRQHDETIYQKIIDVLSAPLHFQDETVSLSASAGIASYPRDGEEIDTLLRHADQAMYLAKQDGKNKYALFDINNFNKNLKKQQACLAMINAIENKEIVPYLQAKLSIKDKSIIGFEMLSRWLHPHKGELSPGIYLPDLENTQAQIEHDHYMLMQCIDTLAQLHHIDTQFTLNINVSAEYFNSEQFIETIVALAHEHPDKISFFVLEIVESTTLGELNDAIERIKICQDLGYSISLDDFGTSYSSLTYFRALPVNEVKIDKSFVDDILDDQCDLAIIKAIIDMASAFSRKVVAEGVETESQYQKLKEIGCDAAQGYLFAKPMSVADALVLASNNRCTSKPKPAPYKR